MRGLGVSAPAQLGRAAAGLRAPRRTRSARHGSARCGAIDAAELLGARMHMHESLLRARNVEQRVALRRHFAQPAADQHHEIGRLDARQQLRIGADAEIAGVAGMQRDRTHARGGTWSRPAAQSARRSARPRRTPAPTSGCRRASTIGRSAAHSSFCSRLMSVAPGQVSTGSKAARRGPRRARSACPRAARSRPGRAGRWSPM